MRLGSNGIPEGLELTPCFDIAPSNGNAESVTRQPEHQAIGIGREGSARSIRNLFSAIEEFGIDEATALRIFDEVHDAVSGWQQVFDDEGVTRRDQELIAHRILSARLGFDDAPRFNRLEMK